VVAAKTVPAKESRRAPKTGTVTRSVLFFILVHSMFEV
jgi:hypothetical protein